jgi:hypothetical protein
MPTPFSGAAATDATIVPWKSSCGIMSFTFRNRIGRPANSGWFVSIPSSMIVSGKPAAGAVRLAAPICGSHHGAGSTGSPRAATPPLGRSRSLGCA